MSRSRLFSRHALFATLLLVGVVASAAGAAVYRSRRPLRTIDTKLAWPRPRFLDGGRLLGVAGEQGGWPIDVFSVEDGRRLVRIEDPSPRHVGAASSIELSLVAQRGSLFAVYFFETARRGAPWTLLVSARTGAEIREIDGESGEVIVRVSPLADWIAFQDAEGKRVRVIATGDPSIVRTLRPPEGRSFSMESWGPIFSTNGRLACTLGGSTAIYSVEDGAIARVVSGTAVSFTDRDDLIVRGEREGRGEYKVIASEGSSARVLDVEHDGCGFQFPVGSPTYAKLSSERPESLIVVRSLATGEVMRSVHAPIEDKATSFDLSPSGDRLAVGLPGGLVEIWEIPPP